MERHSNHKENQFLNFAKELPTVSSHRVTTFQQEYADRNYAPNIGDRLNTLQKTLGSCSERFTLKEDTNEMSLNTDKHFTDYLKTTSNQDSGEKIHKQVFSYRNMSKDSSSTLNIREYPNSIRESSLSNSDLKMKLEDLKKKMKRVIDIDTRLIG